MAIAVSDLHLSDKPPTARSKELDWYGYMQSCLEQLASIQKAVSKESGIKVPILYAGDIFHTFNEHAAVVNFAIKNLPHGYSIPGQHDLEHHQYKNIERTAYWTLVEAGILQDIEPYERLRLPSGAFVTGFPWDTPLRPCEAHSSDTVEIALIHRYVWCNKMNAYADAPKTHAINAISGLLEGFSFAVFGDNHITWSTERVDQKQTVVNCGCFLQRLSNERHYRAPRIWVLHKNLQVTWYQLDTSVYSWLDMDAAKEEIEEVFDTTTIMDEFQKLATAGVDFLEHVKRVARRSDVTERARNLLNEIVKEFTT